MSVGLFFGLYRPLRLPTSTRSTLFATNKTGHCAISWPRRSRSEDNEMAKLEIAVQRAAKSRITEVDFGNLIFGAVFSDHMLVADYENNKWGEPCVLPYGPMSMTPAASALHHGQSIFEGFEAFRQNDGGVVLFRIADNMARMQRSAARLAMPELDTAAFIDGIAELVRLDRDWVPREEGSSLYIRPVYF